PGVMKPLVLGPPITRAQRLDRGIGGHLQTRRTKSGGGVANTQQKRGVGWTRTSSRRTCFGEPSGKRNERGRAKRGQEEKQRETSSLEAHAQGQGAARTRFGRAVPDGRANPATGVL